MFVHMLYTIFVFVFGPLCTYGNVFWSNEICKYIAWFSKNKMYIGGSNKGHAHTWFLVLMKSALHEQNRSLQCPSNWFGPSKYICMKNNPSKCNPKLKMKTSLEVLDVICLPQEPASTWRYHYKK